MYNPDIKLAFIDETYKVSTKPKIVGIFDSLEEHEATLDKDIAMFTKEELIWGFENSEIFNVATLKNWISIIRAYKIWYNDNVEKCQIAWLKQNFTQEIDLTAVMKKSLYYSIEELLEDIDDDSHLEGLYYNALFILNWYGIDRKEAATIKKRDLSLSFDGKALLINLKDRSVSIENQRCIQIIQEFANLRCYDKQFARNTIKRYEKNDVYLLRRFSKDGAEDIPTPLTSSATYNPQVHSKYKKGKKNFSVAIILLSGQMNRLYQVELEGGDVFEAVKAENPSMNLTKIKARLEVFDVYKKTLK